jgi:FAD/FMN-containing dehydrogenase
VPRFRDIMAKHGAEGAYYGHCSVGCLHIRPLINLKTARGLEQVRNMAEEIFDLVLEYGGAISSEHGDGAPAALPRAGVRPRGVPGLPRVQVGLRSRRAA